MKQENILIQFEKEFEKIRKEFNLVQTLDDFDKIFFFRDLILKEGYVAQNLSRFLSHRIVSTYQSWLSTLYLIVFPNTGNLINVKESEFFSQKEKEEINILIQQIMALIALNSFIGLSKNKEKEADFFKNSFIFWNKSFLPIMLKVTKKIQRGWNQSSQGINKNKRDYSKNILFG